NAKIRGPACLNAAAAQTFLPHITEKAEWVLAGLSAQQITEHIKTAIASGEFAAPSAGAMCYMMSKQQYVSDGNPHWHPHLMFYVATMDAGTWGANLPESPLLA